MSGIIEHLRADEATASWIGYLNRLGDPPFAVELPRTNLSPILHELDVPDEDHDELAALLPTRTQSPDVWWLLERSVQSLVRHMGSVEGPPWFPRLPASIGPLHRYFFVYVFLGTLPHVRAYHRSRGIPDDITRASLADLGRHMRLHRRTYGVGGFELGFWLMLHFRGMIYQLGRLQFERSRLGNRTGEAVRASGLPFGPGSPALAVHVPGLSGVLSPEACDASFALAREFFARHFPDETSVMATCHSWLLDPQLADYLPAESNIIRFQRRFQQAYQPDVDHEWILRFVFGRSDIDIDQLPQRSTLERAIVGHLRAGKHWNGGAGWLLLREVP